MLKSSFEKKNFWIFDLDNTIYDPKSKIFDQIDLRMKKFISSKLNISEEEAFKIQKKFYKEYGTTLSGLMKHYQIQPDEFLKFVHNSEFLEAEKNDIDTSKLPNNLLEIYENIKDNSIFQLFPYARLDYDSDKAIKEIKESINNLKTRLSNLKKINKSLNDIHSNSSSMTWDELKNITFNLHNNEEL